MTPERLLDHQSRSRADLTASGVTQQRARSASPLSTAYSTSPTSSNAVAERM